MPILVDKFTREKRSKIMANISGKDTKPEILVRKYLFNKGLRYRKNVSSLPGKPDIVLPKYKTAVFIHGCFWHGHKRCNRSKIPLTRTSFWSEKISNNMHRDSINMELLKVKEWRVIAIWQCEIDGIKKRECRLNNLLYEITGK